MSFKSGIKAPTKKSSQDGAHSLSRENSEAAISRSSSVSTLASVLEGNESVVAATDFQVGDIVWVNGTKPGSIQFLGETQFAPGVWAGVKLDDKSGKNDGSVAGVRYFDCEPERGIFIRPHRLGRQAGSPGGIDADGKRKLSSGRATPVHGRGDVTPRSGMSTPTRICAKLKPGDRVVVNSTSGSKLGVLRFLGDAEFAAGEWAGVELDDPVGKNDGSVGGKRYFECKMKHGLFAPLHKVSRPGAARNISASLQNRSYSRESLNSTTSSVASSRAGRVKLGITSLSNAQKPPKGSVVSPTQSALQEVLKEKEEHIEQLLKENEQKRMEVSKVTVEMQEAKHNVQRMKEEYNIYIQDNESKISLLESNYKKAEMTIKGLAENLQEEKNKMEDVQFQFEEERVLKSDLETQVNEKCQKIEDLEKMLCKNIGSDELSNKLETLGSELKEKDNHLTKATDELAEVRTQLAVKEAEINQLTSRLDMSVLDVQHLTKEMEKTKVLEEKLRSLEESCKAKDDERQNTASLVDRLQVTIQEAQSKFAEKENEVSTLKNELTVKAEKVVGLQNALEILKTDTQQAQKHSETSSEQTQKLAQEKIKALSLKIDEISSDLKFKESSLQDKTKEFDTLSKSLADRDTQLAQLNQNLVDQQKKYDEEMKTSTCQIQSLEKRISLSQEKSSESEGQLSQQVATLSVEIDKYSNMLKQKEELLGVKEKELENLSKSAAEKDARFAELNHHLDELKKNSSEGASTAESHIQNMQEKISQLEAKCSKNEAQLLQIPELEQRNKDLQAECQEKESSNVKLLSEIASLSDDFNKKNNVVCELQQHLQDMKDQVSALSQGNSEATTLLQNKLTEMKTLYENAQNEYRTNLDKFTLEKESLLKSQKDQASILAQNESALNSITEMLTQKESDVMKVNSELASARRDIDAAHNAMKNFEEQALLMQSEKENFLKDRDQELLSLKRQLSEHSSHLEGKSGEVSEKQQMIEKLSTELHHKEEQISELGDLVAASQKQLELIKKHNEENQSMLEKKVAAFKMEQTKYIEEKEKVLHAEIEKLEKLISEKDKAFDSEKNRSANIEAELRKKETAVSELGKLLKTQEAQLNDTLKNEEKTASDLKSELISLKTSCEKLEAENKELLRQEQSRKLVHQELVQTKDALLKDKMEQQALVKDRESKLEMVQKEVERMRLEFIKHKDELQQKLDVSRMEVEAMKEFKIELDIQHGVLEELQQQLHESEKQCSKLKKELQEKDSLAVEKVEMEQRFKNLEQEATEKSNASCELMERNQKLFDEMTNQEKMLKAKDKELENFKIQKQQEESQLRETFNMKIKSLEQEKLALATEISNFKVIPEKSVVVSGSKGTEDDDEKETLLSQISFLNSIIVDMQKEKEEMKLKQMALENPETDLNFNGVREIPPRMFCDICDRFDLHDTEDCPTQCSTEEVAHSKHGGKRHEERPYCNNCEMFGHWTLECDNEETF